MIQLRTDCLVFETSAGAVPCSAEQVAVELVGETVGWLDPEVLRNAAAGVLRYFREDLGRTSVTVHEFAEALARVLRGLGVEVIPAEDSLPPQDTVELDLRQFAVESGAGFELAFFARLREVMAERLALTPKVVRLTGLRSCVKQLTASQRWCPRCRTMSDHIVGFVRRCFEEQVGKTGGSLVVV